MSILGECGAEWQNLIEALQHKAALPIDRHLVRGGRWRACARAMLRSYGYRGVRPARKLGVGIFLARFPK